MAHSLPDHSDAPPQRRNLHLTGIAWLSIPLISYLLLLLAGDKLLADGDSYWHLAAGQWILENRAIPETDPFSQTMSGAPWTSHEWLSEIILTLSYQMAGWSGLVIITALSTALALAILCRYLQLYFHPIWIAAAAVMTLLLLSQHLFARPHVLALPLMMIWISALLRATELKQPPDIKLLLVMVIWANLHGSFTFGLMMLAPLTLEAILQHRHWPGRQQAAFDWIAFSLLALAASMLNPHGYHSLLFTLQINDMSYTLAHIGEWRPPEISPPSPMGFWLIAIIALGFALGIRLKPIRLLILLGLFFLASKHLRHMDLLALITPILLARPIYHSLGHGHAEQQNSSNKIALFSVVVVALLITPLLLSMRPPIPPQSATVSDALAAAARHNLSGNVLNTYSFGGILIMRGIPPFIDGRVDIYGDQYFQDYRQALKLEQPDKFTQLLERYAISWTLLKPDTAAIALLDQSPEWQRLYSDQYAVIHSRID